MKTSGQALLFAGVVIAGGGWLAATRSEASTVTVRAGAMADLSVRNADIAFYEKRLLEDPASALDLAQLSGLYLQRAREAGDYEDFRRAEDAARRSVTLRKARNGKAMLALASSLLAQHKFEEAHDAAREVVAFDPDVTSYRALLAEIQLELGRYDEARATFSALAPNRRELAIAPRFARWEELQGHNATALQILLAARTDASRRGDLPREQIAWFYLRVADFYLRNGRLDDAGAELRAGLAVEPTDFRLGAALARLAAARGDWKEVVEQGLAIGDRADIATLSLLGDAYRALDQPENAKRYYDAANQAGIENAEPFNRQWTQFRLDHDRAIAETLALLEKEITIRQDVYGYDQLAWGYYRAGRFEQARQSMRSALRLGTEDAQLFFHAGMIERALGRADASRISFKKALRLNHAFHPIFADTARALAR